MPEWQRREVFLFLTVITFALFGSVLSTPTSTCFTRSKRKGTPCSAIVIAQLTRPRNADDWKQQAKR
jgi:hypothetical protein